MNRRARITTGILAVTSTLTFSGCSSYMSSGFLPTETIEMTSLNSEGSSGDVIAREKVHINLSNLAADGTPAIEAPSMILTDARSGQGLKAVRGARLQKGTRLVGLVDNDCADVKPHGFSSRMKAANPGSKRLKLQAYAFTLNEETDVDQLSVDAQDDECVVQVSEDALVHAVAVPNDPLYSRMAHLNAIEAPAAWDTFFGSQGIKNDVIIAVVDTGIDYNHPDLNANMFRNSDGTYGADFIQNDNNPMDDNGHGTHCAGLAGAVMNNGVGGSGVMGSRVKLLAIKSLDANGSGRTSQLVNGINYAIEKRANVISMSFGQNGASSVLQTVVQNAVRSGATVVMAAGNDGRQLTSSNFVSPASYGASIQGAIAVGSITNSFARSSFSNYSTTYVELGSPGSSIYGTYPGNRYASLSGTSMATPVAGGAAALIIGYLQARGVTPTPALVEQLLFAGSVKDSRLTSTFLNGNRLNLNTLASYLTSRYPASGTQPVATPTPRPAATATPRPAATPTPAPQATPVPAAACGSMTGMACDVFKSINAARVQNGLGELQPSANCLNLALSHANDMATNNFFSHTSPTQGGFVTRASRFSLSGFAGENIALGYTSAASVTQGWMNSSGHRANILNSNYRSTGVAVVANASGRRYFVQCFSSASR